MQNTALATDTARRTAAINFLNQLLGKAERKREREAAKLETSRARFFDEAADFIIENNGKVSLSKFKAEMTRRRFRLPAKLESFLQAEGFILTKAVGFDNLIFVSI